MKSASRCVEVMTYNWKYFFSLVAVLMFLCLPYFVHPVSAAMTFRGFATVSDSSTDEYRADDNRAGGTAYAATTLSWDELLVKYRAVNMGQWGTRSEPRRSGYEYNWARTGAEAGTLVSSGQHTGAAAQVRAGLVNVVYFEIGNNDFAYYRDGAKIYSGQIAGAALQQKLDSFMASFSTAFNTIYNAGNVKIIVGTIGDAGLAPSYIAKYPDPVGRKRVSDSISWVNSRIRQLVMGKPNVILLDYDLFGKNLMAKLDSSGALLIGGERIVAGQVGDEPHHLILADGIHAGTVANAIIANIVIDNLNELTGSTIVPFSEQEMLMYAGIKPLVTPTPTARPTSTPQPTCKGDLDADRDVDLIDYTLFTPNFLQRPVPNPASDLVNNDGYVDLFDYAVFTQLFLRPCTT